MKQITKEFAAKFKRNYAYKMGGKQTLIFPNGQQFEFDDREYYSGRGAKYNISIKHDNLGNVEISAKEFKAVVKKERERQKQIKVFIAERKEKVARIEAAKAAGIYSISVREYGSFIELSESESEGKYFDAKRLAKTLNISVSDAELLNSNGKTYVFAKTGIGDVLELYHPSLSCNSLSISFNVATPERLAEFNHNEWSAAPYAGLLGMTNNNNHFVC